MPRARIFLLATALASALAAFALPAAAETVVTVNVPVEFHSLNEHVQTVRVACTLTGKDPVTGNSGQVGGYSSVDIHPDAGGNYSGSLALTWDRSGFLPAQLTMITDPALTASCHFNLLIDGGQYTPNFLPNGATTVPPMVAAAPGTTFVGSTLAH